MSSYCQCVRGDKLVPSFPIALPDFSFLTPVKKLSAFQFSISCLAKPSENPAREEKHHIDCPSAGQGR